MALGCESSGRLWRKTFGWQRFCQSVQFRLCCSGAELLAVSANIEWWKELLNLTTAFRLWRDILISWLTCHFGVTSMSWTIIADQGGGSQRGARRWAPVIRVSRLADSLGNFIAGCWNCQTSVQEERCRFSWSWNSGPSWLTYVTDVCKQGHSQDYVKVRNQSHSWLDIHVPLRINSNVFDDPLEDIPVSVISLN